MQTIRARIEPYARPSYDRLTTDVVVRLLTDPGFRRRVEQIIEDLIEILDLTQLDPDLELEEDQEDDYGRP